MRSKEISVGNESGEIQRKNTGEALALQATSHIIDIDGLDDKEFAECHCLVDANVL